MQLNGHLHGLIDSLTVAEVDWHLHRYCLGGHRELDGLWDEVGGGYHVGGRSYDLACWSDERLLGLLPSELRNLAILCDEGWSGGIDDSLQLGAGFLFGHGIDLTVGSDLDMLSTALRCHWVDLIQLDRLTAAGWNEEGFLAVYGQRDGLDL